MRSLFHGEKEAKSFLGKKAVGMAKEGWSQFEESAHNKVHPYQNEIYTSKKQVKMGGGT